MLMVLHGKKTVAWDVMEQNRKKITSICIYKVINIFIEICGFTYNFKQNIFDTVMLKSGWKI